MKKLLRLIEILQIILITSERGNGATFRGLKMRTGPIKQVLRGIAVNERVQGKGGGGR